MRSKLTKIVRAGSACPAIIHILLILLIGCIGVQTFTSCSSDTTGGGGDDDGGGGGDDDGGGGGQAPSGPSVNAVLEGSGVVWTIDDYPDGYYIFIGGKVYGGAKAPAGAGPYAGKYLADTEAIGTYTNTTVYLGEENSEYTYSVSGNKLTLTVTNGGNSVQKTFTKKTVTLTWVGETGGGGDPNTGGGDGSSSPATNGQLIINGIPDKYNGELVSGDNIIGNNVFSSASQNFLLAAKDVDNYGHDRAEVVNGSVTLKVWIVNINLTTITITDYSGNDKNVEFWIKSIEGSYLGTVTVDFTGGKATGTFIEQRI